MILISFGDFLVGIYLFIIAVYDGVIFKNRYCESQVDWVASTNCLVIGILSTIGSQISLFSMTVLSFVRLYIIRNSKKIPGKVTLTTSILVLTGVIILALTAVTIAVIPIIKLFKDFFVNGVKYANELKLFIGTPGKADITEVLEAYYGRMKTTTLSWNRIHGMVSEMFSHDTGSKDYTNTLSIVHLAYGSDSWHRLRAA